METSFTWDQALGYIRERTSLPIWVKGGPYPPLLHPFPSPFPPILLPTLKLTKSKVYTPEDVSLAIAHNANGIIISNHGGRQLDSVPATLDALRDCAPVAKGKIPIAIDGGIRRGTDIFKAIALGADFCFAGRVPIWGLAVSSDVAVEMGLGGVGGIGWNGLLICAYRWTAQRVLSWRLRFC